MQKSNIGPAHAHQSERPVVLWRQAPRLAVGSYQKVFALLLPFPANYFL